MGYPDPYSRLPFLKFYILRGLARRYRVGQSFERRGRRELVALTRGEGFLVVSCMLQDRMIGGMGLPLIG